MPYDAIVIGAGVNGLAAAVHLATKGWKVAVVERGATAGGAVKTEEITRPGFRHDLYAMNLSLFAGSPFFAAHKDRLFAHGLSFLTAEHCFATAFPDGSWLGVDKDIDTTATRIAAFDPADAERGAPWLRPSARTRRTYLRCSLRRCRRGKRCARSTPRGGRAAPRGSPTRCVFLLHRRGTGSTRISPTKN